MNKIEINYLKLTEYKQTLPLRWMVLCRDFRGKKSGIGGGVGVGIKTEPFTPFILYPPPKNLR